MGVLKRTCVIVGAGEIRDLNKAKSMIERDSFVISADGGLEYLDKMGIVPDLILGDFDSLRKDYELPSDCLVFPSEKDDTDTGIALTYAIENGYEKVIILGGTGGRLDHTVANLSSLVFAAQSGVAAYLVDEQNKAFVLLDGVHEIEKEDSCYISFFNFGSDSSTISLSGLKYPLSDYEMKTNFPIGVSNEFTADKCKVEIKNGIVLAIISKK